MLEEIKKAKKNKLELIKKLGFEPYPEKSFRSMTNLEALENYKKYAQKKIILVGRVRSLRIMGGSAFTHIEDAFAKIQLFFNKRILGEKLYSLFRDTFEIGDIIEAEGKIFKTKSGEITLEVHDWRMLAKSLLPISSEYYGLKDKEELLRKRYLDLMLNSQTRQLFVKKNLFWQTVRQFLIKRRFLEVQTPILENIPGGADARPFITYHNALNRDYYMRISLELSLKRLLVGGYEKVFEIGRVFRNEGIDREHLQEYDMMEFYEAYSDLEKGITTVVKLVKKIVFVLTEGSMKSRYENHWIDWKKNWPRMDYNQAFKDVVGIDLDEEIELKQLKNMADKLAIEYEEGVSLARLIDIIFKKTVRTKIIQPTILTGHPIIISPLAKKDPLNKKRVLRMQLIAGGVELGNGFSELNDPLDQKKRFEEQMKMRAAGDEEAQMMDKDFVEALSYGMPPAFGFGMSERLFSFLMNRSIRETVIFPPMKLK